MPEFMSDLRLREGSSLKALEFAVLTAARTSEVLGAKFDEFDIVSAVWIVPGERMKGGRDHRVPLSGRALEIVKEMQVVRTGDYVFPGLKKGSRLSSRALLMRLRSLRNGTTTHGFRSSFRDWAAEKTGTPNHIVEMALAHAVGDKVEAAYRRGDLLEKRRDLMEAWANYCSSARKQGLR
jgi:integrase